MKPSVVGLLLLCSLGATAAPVLDGPPPRALTPPASVDSPLVAGARPVAIAELFRTARSHAAAWSADGASLIYGSDRSGRMNLWRQPLAGGPATLLSRSDEPQTAQVVTGDGRSVIYQSDVGGREIHDLYAVPAAGGRAVNLTATAGVNESDPVVSPDSRLLAYSARVATEAMTDVGVLDLATRTPRLLTHEASPTMAWRAVAFSQDGRTLLANRTDVGRLHGAVYTIDLATGAATRLAGDEATAFAQASDWSRDGRWIAVTIDTARGDRQAAILEVASGKLAVLKPDAWEQHTTRFSPDSRTLLAVSNVDGRDTVLAYDIASGRAAELPFPAGINSDPAGTLPAFSPDGRRVLFPHESGNEPLEYWIYDVAAQSARPVTHLSSLATRGLPRTRVVHYASADGTIVSAVLWTPNNLRRDGRAPGIVYPHGGPTGQTKDAFDRMPVALAARGYFVLAPNPRGSTGYGRAFVEANRRDLGGGDLEDEVAGAQFLAATGYVDAAKIGIVGGSYGGFMTLMAIGKTPQVWAAAVDYFGIVNWTSMYERGSPQLRHYQAGLIGDPVQDKDVYARTSPLTYLGQARAPLLVLQGDNDIRVPREESEQIVQFLRERGRTVDVHYYPDEGHGFSKREDQVDALGRTVAWFDRYLKPASAARRP